MPGLRIFLTGKDEIGRWERVAGKALKDWTTRVMAQRGCSRADAREIVLGEIGRQAVPYQTSVWWKKLGTFRVKFRTPRQFIQAE